MEDVDPSVGSVGDTLDDALAEGTVGFRLEDGLMSAGEARGMTSAQLRLATGRMDFAHHFDTETPARVPRQLMADAVEKLHLDHDAAHKRQGRLNRAFSGLAGTGQFDVVQTRRRSAPPPASRVKHRRRPPAVEPASRPRRKTAIVVEPMMLNRSPDGPSSL